MAEHPDNDFLREAASLFRKAAESGDDRSQRILAGFYHHGIGVRQDDAEALKWFTKAVEQGNLQAQVELADMYQVNGPYQSNVNAYMWYSIAAASGHQTARDKLEVLAALLNPEEISEGKQRAVTWQQTAPIARGEGSHYSKHPRDSAVAR